MVKHIKNAKRLGFDRHAQEHFLNVNKCDVYAFAEHYVRAESLYNERCKVNTWELCVPNIDKLGGQGIKVIQKERLEIVKPFEDITSKTICCYKNLCIPCPKILSVAVDNYDGVIVVVSNHVQKIEWFLNDKKIKRTYNNVGKFTTKLKTYDLECGHLNFKLIGKGGTTYSQPFIVQKR